MITGHRDSRKRRDHATALSAFIYSRACEVFIICVTIVAGILTGLETSPSIVAGYGHVLHALDLVVLWTFALEIALKMAAQGRRFWRFFLDGWHIFDFFIVAVSMLPLFFPAIHTEFFLVFRLVRILRVVRLIEELPRLHRLVHALLSSLPSMSYVALLVALHFYVYAVAGVTLFSTHAPKSFDSLPTAMVTLFQIITADGWSDIMNNLLVSSDYPPLVIALYFISFIVIGAMILLNLFIGIITSEMAEIKAEEDRLRSRREQLAGHIDVEETISQMEEQLQKLRHYTLELKAQNELRMAAEAAETDFRRN